MPHINSKKGQNAAKMREFSTASDSPDPYAFLSSNVNDCPEQNRQRRAQGLCTVADSLGASAAVSFRLTEQRTLITRCVPTQWVTQPDSTGVALLDV